MPRPLHEIYFATVVTRDEFDPEVACVPDPSRVLWVYALLSSFADELQAERITTIPAAVRWLALRGAYSPSPQVPPCESTSTSTPRSPTTHDAPDNYST